MIALFEVAAGLLILSGATVVGIAGLGLVRLPDPFMRMHAATKAGVVGSGLIMLGAALAIGSVGALITGVLGVVFLLATSPIASHALGRSAYISGAPIASATVADALAGVLPRDVFDITPGRALRRRLASPNRETPTPSGGFAMSAIELRRTETPGHAAAPLALRSLTVWLAGGPAQPAATAVAFDLAAATGARVTGLSAIDPAAASLRGAVPLGGLAWSKWAGDQRLNRMRERAARALAEFQATSSEATVDTRVRHEEKELRELTRVAAGTDLVVVPADIDPAGEPARFNDELAARLAAASLSPVLRVSRRPFAVRRIAVVVSDTPACPRIAAALVRTGLWPDVPLFLVRVGAQREHVAALAEEQANLLRDHGRRVERIIDVALDAERGEMEELLQGFDAVAIGACSNRQGWFGAVREDFHEVVVTRTALVLLP